MTTIVISVSRLRTYIINTFIHNGVSDGNASRCANVLLYADKSGLSSHGINNLIPIYVDGIEAGNIDPTARLFKTKEAGAVTSFDAKSMIGLLAAQDAMTQAIKRAAELGASIVSVSNSTHFGAAGYYSLMAAEAGMIGVALTNLGAQPISHAMGSAVPIVGTNPIGFAAPTASLPHFNLDMSTTVCASGKIAIQRLRGENCPEGWLVDSTGAAVQEPHRYTEKSAFLQPLGGWLTSTGGHKGFGLGLMVDVLCGVLSGSDVGVLAQRSTRNSIGHFFLVIDPSFFVGSNNFQETMEQFCTTVLGTPVFSDYPPLRYPGHQEHVNAEEADHAGIRLPRSLVAQLNEYAKKSGLNEL